MDYTEVTREGLGGRLMESIKGVLVGVVFLIIAFPVMFWNEGRAIKTARSLAEGAKSVISIPADAVDPANEGKLVALSGVQADTKETLTDPEFEVSHTGLRLDRKVQMYQWQEKKQETTEKNLGGSTTTTTKYTYAKEWSGSLIKSSEFKDPSHPSNPATMPYESTSKLARDVSVGAFKLSPELIGQVQGGQPIAVTEAERAKLPATLREKVKVADGDYYVGHDLAAPEVGDVRIHFQAIDPQPVSLVARQTGKTFAPWPAAEGRQIMFLYTGVHSADEMFKSKEEEGSLITWVARGALWALMMLGLGLLFQPFATMADIVPFFGDMLRFGVGLFAFVVGTSLSLLTIAVGWVFYRPLVGIPLLLLAVGGFVAIKTLGSNRRQAAAAAAAG